jgi:hypothetical protein
MAKKTKASSLTIKRWVYDEMSAIQIIVSTVEQAAIAT